MLLPPGGAHMPTCAPSVATVRGEKSTTGIPKVSRNVATAAPKSCTAMAIRGMAVIIATSSSFRLLGPGVLAGARSREDDSTDRLIAARGILSQVLDRRPHAFATG